MRGRLEQGSPELRQAAGTAASRAAMLRRPARCAVGMRSKTDSYRVQRPGDDAHLAGDQTGVVQLEGQAESLLHGLLRDPLVLRRAGVTGFELGQGAPVELGQGGVTLGGEVGEPVVVAGDADMGGADRVQAGPLVDVGVGDGVNLSHMRPYGKTVQYASGFSVSGRSRRAGARIDQVLTTRSAATPHSAARSQPLRSQSSWPGACASVSMVNTQPVSYGHGAAGAWAGPAGPAGS